jgi:hypothetical protein
MLTIFSELLASQDQIYSKNLSVTTLVNLQHKFLYPATCNVQLTTTTTTTTSNLSKFDITPTNTDKTNYTNDKQAPDLPTPSGPIQYKQFPLGSVVSFGGTVS